MMHQLLRSKRNKRSFHNSQGSTSWSISFGLKYQVIWSSIEVYRPIGCHSILHCYRRPTSSVRG